MSIVMQSHAVLLYYFCLFWLVGTNIKQSIAGCFAYCYYILNGFSCQTLFVLILFRSLHFVWVFFLLIFIFSMEIGLMPFVHVVHIRNCTFLRVSKFISGYCVFGCFFFFLYIYSHFCTHKYVYHTLVECWQFFHKYLIIRLH